MTKDRSPLRMHPYLRPSSLIGVALAAVLITAAGLFMASPEGARAQQCPAQFTLDFNDLPAGTILGEQYADLGVHISAVANGDHPDALVVFDTDAEPTHDPDLAVDIGNIAVLAENVRDSNGDGLVDDPDENNFGGRAIFNFDQDVTIRSFVFVDHDHQPTDHAAAYDASGNLIKQVVIPLAGNGSVQQIDVNAEGVRRFELVYRDSAGFGGIEVECEQPGGAPTPTPVDAGGATPTPVVAAVTTPSPAAAAQQPVAVAAAVQAPAPQAAQAAAPIPAGVPSMGGDPSDGSAGYNWMAIGLLATGLALFAGGAVGAVREMGFVREIRRRR